MFKLRISITGQTTGNVLGVTVKRTEFLRIKFYLDILWIIILWNYIKLDRQGDYRLV